MILLYWFVVVVSGIGIGLAIFHVQGSWGPYNRFKGLAVNADVAAWSAAIVLPFGYVRLLAGKWQRRVWAAFGVLTLCLAVVASGTRGALIGLAAAVLTIHILKVKSWKFKIAIVSVVALLVVAVLAGILPGVRTVDPRSDISSGRLGLWQAGLDLWTRSPLIGWGFGATSSLPPFAADGSSLHNAYLTVILELGIVGIALFIAIIIGIFANSSLVKHGAIAAAGVAVLINGLVESSLVNLGSPVTTESWLVLGAVLAPGQYERPSEQPPAQRKLGLRLPLRRVP